MLATVHMLTGAMIGAELHSNIAIIVVAFLSHYLLDALPHVDPGTFVSEEKPYSYKQTVIIVIDAITMIAFAVLFYHYHHRWLPIVVGGLVAQLPDFLMPLEKYAFFAPFKKIHVFFHWDKTQAMRWRWYILGIGTQTIMSALALWLVGFGN